MRRVEYRTGSFQCRYRIAGRFFGWVGMRNDNIGRCFGEGRVFGGCDFFLGVDKRDRGMTSVSCVDISTRIIIKKIAWSL